MAGIFRTLSLGGSLSSDLQRTAPRRLGEESGYIEVLRKRLSSLNIKILLSIKENQISQVQEFSTFLCMEGTPSQCVFSPVQLFVTPWTVAHQAPLSMEFSTQEYGGGLPFPSPGNLLHPRIKSGSPTLVGRFFTTSTSWEDQMQESGLTEIIPLICTAVIWRPVCDIFKSGISSGLTLGSGYNLMGARWKVSFSLLSVLRAHGLTLEDCNHW